METQELFDEVLSKKEEILKARTESDDYVSELNIDNKVVFEEQRKCFFVFSSEKKA